MEGNNDNGIFFLGGGDIRRNFIVKVVIRRIGLVITVNAQIAEHGDFNPVDIINANFLGIGINYTGIPDDVFRFLISIRSVVHNMVVCQADSFNVILWEHTDIFGINVEIIPIYLSAHGLASCLKELKDVCCRLVRSKSDII